MSRLKNKSLSDGLQLQTWCILNLHFPQIHIAQLSISEVNQKV